MDLPTGSQLINRGLEGTETVQLQAGTPRRVGLPVPWGVFCQVDKRWFRRGGRVVGFFGFALPSHTLW